MVEQKKALEKINGMYQKFIKPHEIHFYIDRDGNRYIVVPREKSIKAYENDNYRIIQLTE